MKKDVLCIGDAIGLEPYLLHLFTEHTETTFDKSAKRVCDWISGSSDHDNNNSLNQIQLICSGIYRSIIMDSTTMLHLNNNITHVQYFTDSR